MIFHVIPPLLADTGFHCRHKIKIKIADSQTMQQEWLITQPSLKRYDIPVLTKQSIPTILKYFQIETSTYGLDNPTYNPYGRDFFFFELKDPSSGLLGVYLKSRNNPFCIQYPQGDKEFTLTDLLKYEMAIEEAFVFWDAQELVNPTNVNIHLVKLNIMASESKEKAINDYLFENQIINQPKLIKLGCYNVTPTTGLVAPLPSQNTWENDIIEAIYFDAGIRVLPEAPSSSLPDLLKLSNGAKNAYLFSFKVYKKEEHITLPDAPNPYQAIRDWKRDHGFYEDSPLVKNNYYDEKICYLPGETTIEGYSQEIAEMEYFLNGKFTKFLPALDPSEAAVINNFYTNYKDGYFKKILEKISFPIKTMSLGHRFETNDCIYHLFCQNAMYQKEKAQKYRNNLFGWLIHCPVKAGFEYSGEQIRNKFGRSDKPLYDEKGTKYDYEYYEKSWWQKDEFYIFGSGLGCIVHTRELPPFEIFLNTTPPPTKPQELE
ncbi:MAG: hypothetical protein Q8872_01250 [Candidatus Phytoplasma australasiaticum]|nr:hypothetical protein [Candidatus Phytoplasma australasiaticum]